jgi:hypothetical protein
MEPDQVQTSEIDTMELVRQAEELGLQPTDTLTSEWNTGPEQDSDGGDEAGDADEDEPENKDS